MAAPASVMVRTAPAPAAGIWSDPRPLAVLGAGAALPGRPVPTAELLERIDVRFGTTIAARGAGFADKLGVRFRHTVRDFHERREGPRPGDPNPELAARAVRAALDRAGLAVSDLSYLIGHTATPALPIPSNISLVADLLDFHGPHMELRQACTGFVNALVIAQGLLSTPGCGAVAIVGSETGSPHLDPIEAQDDVSQLINLVMMGDGAGAVVLGAVDGAYGEADGVLSKVFLGQIGAGRAPGLSRREGGSAQPWTDARVLSFTHDFEHVRATGPELFQRAAAQAAEMGADVPGADYVLPHQASGRIGLQFERYVGFPAGRVFVNADRVGNTGSAAIWLAFSELQGRLEAGHRVAVLGAEATKHLYGGFSYTHG